MFNLLKKIANYFTPLDEEAEVEKAAASASLANSDDGNKATRTVSDKMDNYDPPVPSEQQYDDSNSDMATTDLAKKRRTSRSQNPGEGKFKIDIASTSYTVPSNPPTSTHAVKVLKKAKSRKDDSFRMYEVHDDPSVWTNSQPNKTPADSTNSNGVTTSSPSSEDQENAETTTPTEHHKNNGTDEATAPKKNSKGRPKKTPNSRLGKRPIVFKEQDPKKKIKSEATPSPPTATAPTKRRRQRRMVPYEPHTTRGRSKKLGDYQCLICGETFFDLESRDNHAETVHPRSSQWKH